MIKKNGGSEDGAAASNESPSCDAKNPVLGNQKKEGYNSVEDEKIPCDRLNLSGNAPGSTITPNYEKISGKL